MLAKVTRAGGMLGEGVSDKRGWAFICHQGVQTADPSPGVFLGLVFLFFKKFLSTDTQPCVAGWVNVNSSGKPWKEKAPPASLQSQPSTADEDFPTSGPVLPHLPRVWCHVTVLRVAPGPPGSGGFSTHHPQDLWV